VAHLKTAQISPQTKVFKRATKPMLLSPRTKRKKKNWNITRVWRNFPHAQADAQLRQARERYV